MAESKPKRSSGNAGRRGVIAVPFVWLGLFFILPFIFVMKVSVATQATAIPPYTPLFDWSGGGWLPALTLDWGNFQTILGDSLYISAYLGSIRFAFFSTVLCLLVAYPIAYGLTRIPMKWRAILLMMVVLPFWTSELLRIYAWIALLKDEGLINNLLEWLGIIDRPITMLTTPFAVYLGMVYVYLPFMLLPLYSTLEKQDPTLLEAATDLGASRIRAFFSVTVPLSLPGIIAGSLLVFIPSVGEFIIPSLLGGPNTLMIGRVMWDEFFLNQDWPTASALSIGMLVFLVVPIILFQHFQVREEKTGA